VHLVGIDGAKRGYWVVASQGSENDTPVFEISNDLTSLFNRAAAREVLVVIDVPIGILSGAAAAAGRVCDSAARAAVGPIRASSVFTPPCREAFGKPSQREASAENRLVCGRGISCQAFGILPRIEATDAMMTPALQRSVREGHPEVTYTKLKGSVIEYPKKSFEGRRERLALLEVENITFDVDAERLRLGRGVVSPDDIIDAAAMLVSARRIHKDDAEVLGDDLRDTRGLMMQIWA
jgi:predicted RNase H-like nuclease